MEKYIYVLKLVPKLRDKSYWTEREEKIVRDHFLRLKKFTEENKVILAGRTSDETQPASFGLVIFEASGENEAKTFMNEDPAVSEGIMTAKLYPFTIALIR